MTDRELAALSQRGYEEKERRTNMTRRLAVVGCVGALTVVLAACGSDSSSDSTSETGSLEDQSAVMTSFGGSAGTAVEKGFGEPVVEQTGLNITYDEPTDYAKLQTQVESNNVSWTVVQGDPYWALQHCGELLEPIPADVDQSNVDPKYSAGECQVPGDSWSLNMAYDPTKFPDDPPSSWADFFDTEKYPGKRAIFGSYAVNGALEGALMADGVPPNKLYPLDLDRAIAKLDTIRDDTTFYDTGAQAEQLLQNKQVVMIAAPGNELGYTGDFAPVWKGSLLSWDAYIVPKGANMEAASAILNNIATKDAQEKYISVIPFGGTLKTPLTPPEDASDLYLEWSAAVPENIEQSIPLDQEYYAEHYDEVNSRWTSYVQGG